MQVKNEEAVARVKGGMEAACPCLQSPVSTLGRHTGLRARHHGVTPAGTTLQLCALDSSLNLFVPQFSAL